MEKIKKDCINCNYTRVNDNEEPCCNCEDYSKFESDEWMKPKISETEGCCYSSNDFPKKKDVFDINPYE